MQDKTINNALLSLRKQIIRGNGDGLAHVEALLVQRGVSMPRVLPPRRKGVAKCGHMTLWVSEALNGGPKPLREVVTHIAMRRPDITADQAYGCTVRVLVKLKAKGLVARTDKLWRLV